jgi:hypothetical protein
VRTAPPRPEPILPGATAAATDSSVVRYVTERVLVYRQDELDAWKAGDRSMVPDFYPAGLLSRNQLAYGFAEMLTLRHYHDEAGWLGFLQYDLAASYPCQRRRLLGRRKVREIIPQDLLQQLRALQHHPRGSPGQPDLFLYRDVGDFMFVEVKKGTDTLREPQYRSIAQIMAVLGCPVDIVYAREERQRRRPKRYAFDLEAYGGHSTR